MKHTLICTAMAAGCLQATQAGAAPQTINLITFGGDAVANAAVSIQVKGAPRTAPASARAGNRQRSQMSSLKTSAIVPLQHGRRASAGPCPAAAEPAI